MKSTLLTIGLALLFTGAECQDEPGRARSVASATSAEAPAPSATSVSLRERVAEAKRSTVAVGLALQTPDGRQIGLGFGSGVVVAPHRVLTCAHVLQVPPLAKGITPLFYFVARDSDWATDPTHVPTMRVSPEAKVDAKKDLALLTVPNLDAPPLKLAAAQDVAEGDDVFFIGHPRFQGMDTPPPAIGTAVIAAKDVVNGTHLYRLDGSVNHGNSGGALVARSTGRLIGIVNAKVGEMSPQLQAFKDAPQSARIVIGGTDPVAVLQQTINQLQDTMQLGIGLAVDTGEISQFLDANR